MKNLILSIGFVLSLNALAECVHERLIIGSQLKQMQNASVFVETDQAIFKPVSQIKIKDDGEKAAKNVAE